MAYSVADCQHKYGQLHTFKTTADSCRLLRQLETAADYYTHVCSCLFIEVITHHLPNGCRHGKIWKHEYEWEKYLLRIIMYILTNKLRLKLPKMSTLITDPPPANHTTLSNFFLNRYFFPFFYLFYFQFFTNQKVRCDTWHMTPDLGNWHLTRDTWHVTYDTQKVIHNV